MEEIMVICKKCGNKALSSSMRLDLDEKMVICPECIKNKQIHKEIEKEAYHKVEEKETGEEKLKIAHKCNSCGYKFKIDAETKIPKYCPYCNARVLSF